MISNAEMQGLMDYWNKVDGILVSHHANNSMVMAIRSEMSIKLDKFQKMVEISNRRTEVAE